MAGQHDRTIYWLDQDDRIERVGEAWDRFALDNDGATAIADLVTGRPVWDFVSGETSRMWLESLLSYTRLHGKPLTRRYRCDSPDVRRFMTMAVVREGRHQLRVEHTVQAIEPRERTVGIVPAAGRTAGVRLRCSICGRIKDADAWAEPDLLSPASGDDPSHGEFTVIYTVCAECQLLLPQASTRPVDRLRD